MMPVDNYNKSWHIITAQIIMGTQINDEINNTAQSWVRVHRSISEATQRSVDILSNLNFGSLVACH